MNDKQMEKLLEPHPVLLAIFGLLVTWALVHVALTRHATDYWHYGLPTVVVTGIFIFIVFLTLRIQGDTTISLGNLVLIPLLASLGGGMYYAIGASLKDLFFWIRNPDNLPVWVMTPSALPWLVILASLFVLLTGFGLFFFRLRMKCVYGFTEILAGLAVTMQRINGLPDKTAAVLPDLFIPLLTASIYLVVRGCVNMHEGLTKEPIDPVAVRIVTWLKSRVQYAFAAKTIIWLKR